MEAVVSGSSCEAKGLVRHTTRAARATPLVIAARAGDVVGNKTCPDLTCPGFVVHTSAPSRSLMARQHVAPSNYNRSTSGAMCQVPGWLCGSLRSGPGLSAISQPPQSFSIKADSTIAESALPHSQENGGGAKALSSVAVSQMVDMQVIAVSQTSSVWHLRG